MSLFGRWRFGRELKRLAASQHPVLQNYAAAQWPTPNTRLAEVPLLALDFELDGLERDAHLLQAGWVDFTTGGIPLERAVSRDIRSSADLRRDAVVVHGIGVERASAGEPIGAVLEDLIAALAGRFMVAHSAGIEQFAISRASKSVFGYAMPVRALCTLTLERHLSPNLGASDAYRLANCRERYGLPEYRAHDALTDAIAAGARTPDIVAPGEQAISTSEMTAAIIRFLS